MIKQGERSLSLALYNMNLKSEGPFSSSAYILNCNSTTKKKERKKSTKLMPAALEVLYLSQSQKK